MDIVSHGLWGGFLLGRTSRKDYIAAGGFSVLPDVLAEGIMFGLIGLGLDNMPGLGNGHPNITEFPAYARNFYNATHSLIVFAAVFLIVWALAKKPFVPLAAWGIHILSDIPTHSLELFPTPFLWPLSGYTFDGIPWSSSIIMIPNITILLLTYSFWFYKRKLRKPGQN